MRIIEQRIDRLLAFKVDDAHDLPGLERGRIRRASGHGNVGNDAHDPNRSSVLVKPRKASSVKLRQRSAAPGTAWLMAISIGLVAAAAGLSACVVLESATSKFCSARNSIIAPGGGAPR